MSVNINDEKFTTFADYMNDEIKVSKTEKTQVEFEAALIGKLVEARESRGSSQIDVTKSPTPEQIAMLTRASQRPVPADDEYPEFSEIELTQFKRLSGDRRADRNKQTVTLRLSPQALQKAKSLGKGYTSVLSRILESALENPEIVKHNL